MDKRVERLKRLTSRIKNRDKELTIVVVPDDVLIEAVLKDLEENYTELVGQVNTLHESTIRSADTVLVQMDNVVHDVSLTKPEEYVTYWFDRLRNDPELPVSLLLAAESICVYLGDLCLPIKYRYHYEHKTIPIGDYLIELHKRRVEEGECSIDRLEIDKHLARKRDQMEAIFRRASKFNAILVPNDVGVEHVISEIKERYPDFNGIGTVPEDLWNTDVNLLVIKLNNVSVVELVELMSTFERPFKRLTPAGDFSSGSKLDTDAPECMWFYAKQVYMCAGDHCYSRRNRKGYTGEKFPTPDVFEELVNFG